MGHTIELICPSCQYEAFTDAGPSGGFFVFTNTYICLDCRSLVDLVTRKRNDEFYNALAKNENSWTDPSHIHEGHYCPKCSGGSFVLWDSFNKPCPRCYAEMVNNPQAATTVFWD